MTASTINKPINPRPLLPHTDEMVLIDAIILWDFEKICCTANSHLHVNNPLRQSGQLSIYAGIEYAVQAMAAHAQIKVESGGGIIPPRKGFLAAMSRIKAYTQNLDDATETLHIEAQAIASTPNSSMYKFTISANNFTLLEGQLTAVMESTPS